MSEDELGFPHLGGIPEDQKVPTTAVKKEKRIPVIEMFGPTIEGEGSLIGMQTMFIRFGLCDFKCKNCDSMHAVDPHMVKLLAGWRTEQEIADDMAELMLAQNCAHIPNITLSGGNPAIHDLRQLVSILHDRGKKVFVETQGTKAPEWLHDVDHIVVSPKSPGMGEHFDHEVFINFMHKYLAQGAKMTVKIVVFSARDLEFASAVYDLCEGLPGFKVRENFYLSLGNPNPPKFSVVLDPDDGKASVSQDEIAKAVLIPELLRSYSALAEEILRDPRLANVRFLPQLHVLAWGNETGR